ncbi:MULTISPECIES: thiamine phosphate synthase [Candidatus Ichthyocystis]|uniref:thiamine phosphate synthase n=1 Tax=Candidatus Ichthyocystis TaxID=2929841 RepID=UPI000AD6E65E|nr:MULTISPECIES: thiamine phosphate synthase [Ichthyocystis]
MDHEKLRLVLVTNRRTNDIDQYIDFVCKCAQWGATCIQLREKNTDTETRTAIAESLITRLRKLNVPIIINDDVCICEKVDADGVHLGQTDGSVIEARKKLGSSKIIGWSVYNYDHILLSHELPIDYIGIGPVFTSSNKANLAALGLNLLRKLSEKARHCVVAIGGINEFNVDKVLRCGADGVACIESIHNSESTYTTIRRLRLL